MMIKHDDVRRSYLQSLNRHEREELFTLADMPDSTLSSSRPATPVQHQQHTPSSSSSSGSFSNKLLSSAPPPPPPPHHRSDIEEVVNQRTLELREENMRLKLNLQACMVENERYKEQAKYDSKKVEAQNVRIKQLEDTEVRFQTLITGMLDDKMDMEERDYRQRLLTQLISPQLIAQSQPPKHYPVPTPPSFTVTEIERLQTRCLLAEKEVKSLRSRVDAEIDNKLQYQREKSAEVNALQRKVDYTSNQLLGAVRRVKWLLDERTKVVSATEKQNMYIRRLENKVLEQNSTLRRLRKSTLSKNVERSDENRNVLSNKRET